MVVPNKSERIKRRRLDKPTLIIPEPLSSYLEAHLSNPLKQTTANIDPDDRVITLNEAAQVSCLSIATLRRRLAEGAGPRIVRMSERRVGVRVRDLRAWIEANTSPALQL